MQIAIKSSWDGHVLFEADVSDDTEERFCLRVALELAVNARANLVGADLARADLARADLARADLARADLARANLARADLVGADLADANLAGADLVGANLVGAKWRNGITIQRAPLFLSGLHWRVIVLDAHMEIGCQIHRLSEWAAFDDAAIAQMDGREALKFWRAFKEPLLSLARADGRDFSPASDAADTPKAAE